jgi:hypothetical protein
VPIVVVIVVVLVETVDRVVESVTVSFVDVIIAGPDFGSRNTTSSAMTMEMTRKTATGTISPSIKDRRHRRLLK